jgi:putative flippase GtrA
MKKLIISNRSFFTFLFTGVLCTAGTFAIYVALNQIVNYRVAYLISYIGGIVLSYFLNVLFVFKKRISYRSFIKFPLVYLVKYPLAAMCLEFFIQLLGVPVIYAPLLVVALMAPATFLLTRFILLERNQNKDVK